MSEAKVTFKSPIMGALNEIISAMSSLNMPSQPIPEKEIHEDAKELRFLSDTEYWVKHAMKHLVEAINQIEKYNSCSAALMKRKNNANS